MKHLRSRHRSGVATTEAGLLLPIFVLVALGALEISSAIFSWQSVSVAAYEGARVAVKPFSSNSDVEQRCSVILSARRTTGYGVQIQAGESAVDIQEVITGTPITVTVTAPADDNATLLLPLFQGRSFSHSVTMLKE